MGWIRMVGKDGGEAGGVSSMMSVDVQSFNVIV